MVMPGLVVGGNLYTDSSETKHDNRLSQWGAGLEVLTDWVDFRANFYDASSSQKKSGEFASVETKTSTRTTATTTASTSIRTTGAGGVRTLIGTTSDPVGSSTSTVNTGNTDIQTSGAPSEPYAQGNSIWYDQGGGTTTAYTPYVQDVTTTTYRNTAHYETRADAVHTTTTKTTWRAETTRAAATRLFERFERGMDGWDAELGLRLPWKGPETRLFGGWYDYGNPFGEDVEGWKARLEVRPGPWLSLDGELYEGGRLHGSDWFVGFRAQIPLSRDLTWQDFKEGLFSLRPRCLEDRMRGEMARREGVIAAQSDWKENVAKRRVEKQVEVSERVVTSTETETRTQGVIARETEDLGNTTAVVTGPERLDPAQAWTVSTGSGPGQSIKLADHITFVDGAYDEMAGTADGRAVTPYNNLQAAADAARNSQNKTVFVYEPGGREVFDGDKVRVKAGNGGKYEHGVEVHPGITLTSTVSGGVVTYQTVGKPLIDPPESALITTSVRPGIPSAVLLRENTTFERMAVKTTGGHNEGIHVIPVGNTGGDVLIKDSDIDASGCGIYTNIRSGQKLGNLTISGSTITAQSFGVYTHNIGTMGGLSISGSTITAQEDGVYTGNEGTMGDLTISGSSIEAGVSVSTWNYGTMGALTISGSSIESTEKAVTMHNNGTMGGMTIIGSSIKSDGDNGVSVWNHSASRMGDLSISGSTITAQGFGVYTENYGTMGGMEITGAAGNITGGPGYHDIERRCYSGNTSTPLTVDGAAMLPETTVTDMTGTYQQAVWNNP